MKPKPFHKPTGFSRLLFASILFAAANSAHAQTTYYWDADGDATTDTGGTGIWDTTSSLWRNGSATGSLSQWPVTDPAVDYAQFEGTAGTVSLNSDSVNININRITFGTTGYEIKGPASGTATLNLSGTSPQIITGASISATISANISGSTGFSKTGASTLTLKGANTYSGTTSISGGSITVEGDHSGGGGWSIGSSAAATALTFATGSTILVGAGNNVVTPNGGGTAGRAIVVAGSVTTSSTSNLSIYGRSSVSINNGGSWDMQGGTLTIQPLNSGYSANMNVNSGGSFTYSGTKTIIVSESTSTNSGSGNLNLRGTFTTTTGFRNTGAGTNATATSNFTFDGGTLKISNDIGAIFESGGQPFNIAVAAGGGTIDTNGFNTATSLAITGAGGLTKTGGGTLTLSGTNTYAGNTTVTGGTLILAADNISNDASTVTIGTSGVLQLTFAGSDTVDKLFIGATQQPAGLYGHSSTGATNGGKGVGALDARFAEGSGTLTVISDPVGTPFETFMSAYPGLTGDDALPGADPDGDGLSNVAEFIMGGTAPNSGSAANRPVEAVISGHLTMSMLVPSGATFAGSPSPSANVQGVDVAVGGSLDLATFTRPVEETALNPGLPSAPSGHEWHTFRLGEPISSQSRGFLRASFITP